MMNFHLHHRSRGVTLSKAKGLSVCSEMLPLRKLRASAHSLSMTASTLKVKIRNMLVLGRPSIHHVEREVCMLRVIFMGTPQFAVPALEALSAGTAPGAVLPQGYQLVTVITRVDKPAGRGKEIIYSPVKQAALAHGIPVWQPGSLKRPENIEALAAYRADIYIVAAFGQILPQAVLDQPRYGALNIHASLLPKYRGMSPISEAILQGDSKAGVTIMLLDAGVDTGPMLLKKSLPLSKDETTGTLTSKLAALGAQALLEVLPLWGTGKLTP